jgi:hypothetical protein
MGNKKSREEKSREEKSREEKSREEKSREEKSMLMICCPAAAMLATTLH